MDLYVVLACGPVRAGGPSLRPRAGPLHESYPWGKANNDHIAAENIAVLLRGGVLPQASGYPAARRATRDLLRRRMSLLRKRAELLTQVQTTNHQDNRPEIGKKIAYKANRDGVAPRFPDPADHKRIEVDLARIDAADRLLNELELSILNTARARR